MVLSFSQCKKKTVASDDGSKLVPITLEVNGGSKVDVTGNTGEVAFEEGDVIYVASGGKYVGKLKIEEGNDYFSGSINEDYVVAGKPLYFYFLGNKPPYETLTADGSTTSITVDIIDQTLKLPVISAGVSTHPYNSEVHSYSATLGNKCGLVAFNVTTGNDEVPICLTGLNNKVTITFNSDGIGVFEYSKTNNHGCIKLAKGNGINGIRWAIILPQAAESNTATAYLSDLTYKGTRDPLINTHNPDYPTNASVIDNTYIPESDAITVTVTDPIGFPEGAVHGYYTVGRNADGSFERILFSKGNLQYRAST